MTENNTKGGFQSQLLVNGNNSMVTAKTIPKDSQVVLSVMREIGLKRYDPKCVVQLNEFLFKYTTGVLDDARYYGSNMASGTGGGNNSFYPGTKKKNTSTQLDVEDVRLAQRLQVADMNPIHSVRQLIHDTDVNSTPLPTPPSVVANMNVSASVAGAASGGVVTKTHATGLRLPPDRFALNACNYQLKSHTRRTPLTYTETIEGVHQLLEAAAGGGGAAAAFGDLMPHFAMDSTNSTTIYPHSHDAFGIKTETTSITTTTATTKTNPQQHPSLSINDTTNNMMFEFGDGCVPATTNNTESVFMETTTTPYFYDDGDEQIVNNDILTSSNTQESMDTNYMEFLDNDCANDGGATTTTSASGTIHITNDIIIHGAINNTEDTSNASSSSSILNDENISTLNNVSTGDLHPTITTLQNSDSH